MKTILLVLAVLLGAGLALLFRKQLKSNLKLLLAFSGAYLLAITSLHLFPEVFGSKQDHLGVFILVGFLIQIVLEFFSKGLEHGHAHIHEGHLPLGMFISLCIHALLEGMPVAHNHHDHASISPMLTGIFLHKIPVSMLLVAVFIKLKTSTFKTLAYLLIFASMAPLGAWMAEHWFWLSQFQLPIKAIVIGVFLHIATTILFESTEGHRFNLMKLLTILSGFILAYFSH